MKEKRVVHIYTGPGKGKTTAAVGLALRAYARGFKVCYVSFHKDPKSYKGGEQSVLKKLGIPVRCFAKSHPMCGMNKSASKKALAEQAEKGLDFIRKAFRIKQYDMVIADEINICVRDGYLNEQDVLDLMDAKPETIDLVMTGRQATAAMIRKAGMVSFIKEIKHPFTKGGIARKGIEY